MPIVYFILDLSMQYALCSYVINAHLLALKKPLALVRKPSAVF